MSRLQALAPGVWRLPLRTPTLPPATHTNVMIVGHSKLSIIEPATPFEDERAVLDDVIARFEAEGREVINLMITHHHPDHTGDVVRLQDKLCVPVLAHSRTAERVGFDVQRTLDDGEEVDMGEDVIVRAVFTPGHAPGHVVLHELTSNIAHAGDMVAGEGTILVDPDDDGDMRAYLDSLRRLGELATTALVPAHGPVLEDPQGVVDHYIAHRLKREAKVIAAIEAGAQTHDEMVAGAYSDTPKSLWPFAARALEAHLRKLEVEKVVVREDGKCRLVSAEA